MPNSFLPAARFYQYNPAFVRWVKELKEELDAPGSQAPLTAKNSVERALRLLEQNLETGWNRIHSLILRAIDEAQDERVEIRRLKDFKNAAHELNYHPSVLLNGLIERRYNLRKGNPSDTDEVGHKAQSALQQIRSAQKSLESHKLSGILLSPVGRFLGHTDEFKEWFSTLFETLKACIVPPPVFRNYERAKQLLEFKSESGFVKLVNLLTQLLDDAEYEPSINMALTERNPKDPKDTTDPYIEKLCILEKSEMSIILSDLVEKWLNTLVPKHKPTPLVMDSEKAEEIEIKLQVWRMNGMLSSPTGRMYLYHPAFSKYLEELKTEFSDDLPPRSQAVLENANKLLALKNERAFNLLINRLQEVFGAYVVIKSKMNEDERRKNLNNNLVTISVKDMI